MDGLKEQWNKMAADYDGFTSPEGTYSNAIEWPCIKRILPALSGRRVLDVGCGSGRFTYYFAEYGPSELVGIDVSEEMLSLARKRLSPGANIRFEESSADSLSGFDSGSFDFVFSSTTMHYVEELEKAFSEAYRVIAPGGDFMLSLIHPLYSASYPLPGSSEWLLRYQDRSPREYIQPWTRFNRKTVKTLCRSYHYTLADYINAVIKCGFSIRGVHEPQPPQQWKDTNPERYEDVMNEPVYLVIDCRKGSE